jgi:hypothetical protein
MSDKVYFLIKDLPDLKAGAVFEPIKQGRFYQCAETATRYRADVVENSDFFSRRPQPSPAATVRGAEEGFLDVLKRHSNEKTRTPFPFDWKMLQAAVTEYASQFGYTLAQVSDAWDAGQRFEYADGECFDPNPYPDKQTFLNSLKPLK